MRLPQYDSPAVLQGESYAFVQVSGKEQQMKSGSFENHAEGQTVVAIVEQLRRISDNVKGKWHCTLASNQTYSTGFS